MLPTEPNSNLNVSQANKPVLNIRSTFVANNPMLQFANKTGSLIMQHPFWVLVVGSLGIHAAFAVIAPNPLQKPEPPEVVVSTLPVVKLPSKSLANSPKANKSLIDNLFVKSASKTDSPLNTFPNAFPNALSNTPLSRLDLNTLDSLENLPPITDFSFSEPPLSSNNKEVDLSQFVRPQTRETKIPITTTPPRFNTSGQIDNTNPVKTETPNSNLKPEFKNGGLKTEITSPPSTKNSINGKPPDKVSKNTPINVSTNVANTNHNEKEIGNISLLYATDKQIIDLVTTQSIVNTIIAPPEKLISAPGPEREKGVVWIPPKTANATGKSGSVTFMWLVEPNGTIQTRYLKSSGIKELDDIAREAAKGYKFQPIENSQNGKYRLVTATYKFS